jgi:hypothetical protein
MTPPLTFVSLGYLNTSINLKSQQNNDATFLDQSPSATKLAQNSQPIKVELPFQ